ncbi:MAG: hypothetical protein ACKOAD_07715 [Gammaproteobacteria bacterium]
MNNIVVKIGPGEYQLFSHTQGFFPMKQAIQEGLISKSVAQKIKKALEKEPATQLSVDQNLYLKKIEEESREIENNQKMKF